MRIDRQYNQIPDDSDASIQTQGLLGGKYIGFSPGGSDTYLKDGSVIEQTQSAIVLESLINKFFANYAARAATAIAPRPRARTTEQIGVEEMRYATLCWRRCAAGSLLAGAALAQAPRRAGGRATPNGPTRSGADRRPGHAEGSRHGPRRLSQGPRQGRTRSSTSTCCRISTREYAARLVLGQYWRTATPEQRKRFVDAFYHSLLNNYGTALVDFTADRLKIFPSKVGCASHRATVRTEVKRNNGDRVAVNYYLRKTAEGWKAWDVVIDGISYVNSYREDFGPQIEQQGLDAVIKRLESGEKPEAIGKQQTK